MYARPSNRPSGKIFSYPRVPQVVPCDASSCGGAASLRVLNSSSKHFLLRGSNCVGADDQLLVGDQLLAGGQLLLLVGGQGKASV